ncbi:DUF429 domain-containing protein [Dethiobacter alkaliphilus]|uniref:DUF429 domain-containing protein n=1 Tax=Dethiobacter alkaliphilus TaxID=427926 RepID=UPI0022273ECB|nr:DUF429 domain-containing protein [Dethiobacter alkaliphilus]MCW3491538.1 DUF429 domain-containing protein [Dethiobacter alkaliphilus]
MRAVGVDGCKTGWLAVCLSNNMEWEIKVCKEFSEIYNEYNNASLILIDVPIGLKERGVDERQCDKLARKILGQGRGSSVFRVPARPAIYKETYEEAKEANFELTTKKITKQAWGICSKIKELDSFLNSHIEARKIIRESHPELCFCALTGRPMRYNKQKKDGFAERKHILFQVHPRINDIINSALSRYTRQEVKRDDILDAIVLAITALTPIEQLISTPDEVQRDNLSLPMEIVYRRFVNS